MVSNIVKKKIKLPKLSAEIIIDPNILKRDPISIEKQKRQQIEILLDSLLSNTSIFDFFSFDSFQLILFAKYFTQVLDQSTINSESIFFSFLISNLKMSSILSSANVTKFRISEISNRYFNIKKKKSISFSERFRNFFSFNSTDIKFKKELPLEYSYECKLILEKSVENALNRFKTPIITPEILFLTLMEDKKGKVGKLIQSILPTEIDWYILRYKLIKMIHKNEICIRELKTNQHYFAYLLKKSLSENEFETLVETEQLSEGVSFFRNRLISQILSFNLFDHLEKEIYTSIQITGNRTYKIQKKIKEI